MSMKVLSEPESFNTPGSNTAAASAADPNKTKTEA